MTGPVGLVHGRFRMLGRLGAENHFLPRPLLIPDLPGYGRNRGRARSRSRPWWPFAVRTRGESRVFAGQGNNAASAACPRGLSINYARTATVCRQIAGACTSVSRTHSDSTT